MHRRNQQSRIYRSLLLVSKKPYCIYSKKCKPLENEIFCWILIAFWNKKCCELIAEICTSELLSYKSNHYYSKLNVASGKHNSWMVSPYVQETTQFKNISESKIVWHWITIIIVIMSSYICLFAKSYLSICLTVRWYFAWTIFKSKI